MTKGQKTISIPQKYYKELDEFFKKNEEIMKRLDITSTSSLVRVLSRLGQPTLEKLLSVVDALISGKMSKQELAELIDKLHKDLTD